MHRGDIFGMAPRQFARAYRAARFHCRTKAFHAAPRLRRLRTSRRADFTTRQLPAPSATHYATTQHTDASISR